MFRPRVSRSLAAATISAALVIGVMAGTTSAKPKPTPTPTPTPTVTPTPTPVPTPSGSRKVYFGDPASEPDGYGRLDLTPFTAGGTFSFDVIARNVGSQNLTHAMLGLGTAAEAWADAPGGEPSLPEGSQIVAATVVGASCPFTAPATGFSCDIGNFPAGASVTATFVVETTAAAEGAQAVWASFKVAENVSDQGANANSFFASQALNVTATSSDAIGTYLRGGNPFKLSTSGLPGAGNDVQTTTVEVPGDNGAGHISIFESDDPTGCTPVCIGQLVSLNVRDGAPVTPYLVWTLVINEVAAVPSQGGVLHTEDDGTVVNIPNTKASACTASKTLDCLVEYTVDKKAGTTTIVFQTGANGAARGY